MEGDTLPFQQAQTENGWGMSVVERIFERIEALILRRSAPHS
jgi:hypothetical protein